MCGGFCSGGVGNQTPAGEGRWHNGHYRVYGEDIWRAGDNAAAGYGALWAVGADLAHLVYGYNGGSVFFFFTKRQQQTYNNNMAGQASDSAHLPNERIRVENLVKGKAVIERFLQHLPAYYSNANGRHQ